MGTATRVIVDDRLRDLAANTPGLSLLVLHGSRARGDAHDRSDWDLAFEAEPPFDPDSFLAALVELLGADRIDLADLTRAGALLRFGVARDGVVVFERNAGRYDRFRLEAIDAWCDLAPVLQPAYARALAAVGR